MVPAEVERERVRTLAEAEADRIRLVKGGEADGQRLLMEAEALGLLALLTRRAEGLGALVNNAGGNPQLAALLLIAEQMPNLVAEQVKAISNLKIDQVTVWDSGGSDGKPGNSTANFLSGLASSLPQSTTLLPKWASSCPPTSANSTMRPPSSGCVRLPNISSLTVRQTAKGLVRLESSMNNRLSVVMCWVAGLSALLAPSERYCLGER